MRRQFDMPMTPAEIKRKIAAWGELFGAEPYVTVEGGFYADDGRLTYPDECQVTHVGRKWITARLDGEDVRLDPMRCAPRVRCYLTLAE